MEYCDLKRDKASGQSKGFCYVNYSTPEAAIQAMEQLNGFEYPPHSGHRLKVAASCRASHLWAKFLVKRGCSCSSSVTIGPWKSLFNVRQTDSSALQLDLHSKIWLRLVLVLEFTVRRCGCRDDGSRFPPSTIFII
jgi:RNA recognition motif-containing protein